MKNMIGICPQPEILHDHGKIYLDASQIRNLADHAEIICRDKKIKNDQTNRVQLSAGRKI